MKEKLIRLGLTDREAEAYLALYNFNEASATQIAKLTKEHRTNIYDTLSSLIKKGLISYNIKNNVKYFHVSNPEKLLDFVEEKEKIAKNIIPELRSKLKVDKEKPIVEVYEGKEGFKSILSMILRERQTIYGIGASEKNKIHAKLLYVKGSKFIDNKMNEIKFLPNEFSQPSTIAIFGEYIAIFMWTEPMTATLTKSKQLSNSFKEYFNLMWKIAKK